MPADLATASAKIETGRATLNASAAIVDEIVATTYNWVDPEKIPRREWVLGRWMLRGAVTAVVAPGGVGKTTLLCGSALSLVTARPLLAKKVWGERKRVWIWNLEDPLEELQRSIQASAKHYNVTQDDIGGYLFVDTALEGTTLCTAIEDAAGFRLIEPVYAAVTAELVRRKIDVLIIDPFVSSHQVEENANSKIDKIAKAWSRVANYANCAVVLVHHTSKAGAGDVTALSARGAKALTDACRAVLVLNRMDSETAERLGIDDQQRRRHFSVADDKHNRTPAENAEWYRIASVDLGNGNELISGDMIGVAEPWSPPDPFEGMTPQHLYEVQLAVDAGEWRANIQANGWVGNVVAQVLGLDVDDKADRRRINRLIKTWLKEGALVVVKKPDGDGDQRPFIQVGRWQNDTSAPPKSGGVGHGGAIGQITCPTTTPIFNGGVGRGIMQGGCDPEALATGNTPLVDEVALIASALPEAPQRKIQVTISGLGCCQPSGRHD